MTIDELLNCSSEEIKKMTDEQLLEYFKPYLHITRPELAKKPEKSVPRKAGDKFADAHRRAKFDMLSNLAKQMGVELDLTD